MNNSLRFPISREILEMFVLMVNGTLLCFLLIPLCALFACVNRLYPYEIRKGRMPMKKKRKKRHCVIKAIFRLLIVLVCLVLGVGAFFGVKGYEMYQDAIAERTLDERVEDIRNTENFTIYSELPQFYIDATISVEDHRFADHCGIDLIPHGSN